MYVAGSSSRVLPDSDGGLLGDGSFPDCSDSPATRHAVPHGRTDERKKCFQNLHQCKPFLCRYSYCENINFVKPGSVFTDHSQEYSLSFSPRLTNLNVTQLVIG